MSIDLKKETDKYLDKAYKDEPSVLYIGEDEFNGGGYKVKVLKSRAFDAICEDMQKFFETLILSGDNDNKSYTLKEGFFLDEYKKICEKYKFDKSAWDKWAENCEDYYKIIEDKKTKKSRYVDDGLGL